jgi:dTDP-4-dehydrorhamnose reductase
VQAVGRPELDLERPGSAAALIRELRPDVVVNAAAYTGVDRAEQDAARAFQINANGAGEVSAAAWEIGAKVVQISTDYVFSGVAERAWQPGDPTHPQNIYGASKLAGERQVRAANPNHLILRTSWVFSPFGRNFVSTMLRLAGEREEVTVVDDQFGRPTSAHDLAAAILAVSSRWQAELVGLGSTMHFAGAGRCNWAAFAQAVFDVSREAGGPTARVVPIATNKLATPARRPAYSVLDCSTFRNTFELPTPAWSQALPATITRLLRTTM